MKSFQNLYNFLLTPNAINTEEERTMEDEDEEGEEEEESSRSLWNEALGCDAP